MPNETTSTVNGKLTLTPEAPPYGGSGWLPGDPPPPPAVYPPSGSSLWNGVPIIPTVNGVPQTQQPAPPYGFTVR